MRYDQAIGIMGEACNRVAAEDAESLESTS